MNRFPPIPICLSEAVFIRAPIQVSADAAVSWFGALGMRPLTEAVPAGLHARVRCLDPMSHPPDRYVLLSTCDGWTVCLSNSLRPNMLAFARVVSAAVDALAVRVVDQQRVVEVDGDRLVENAALQVAVTFGPGEQRPPNRLRRSLDLVEDYGKFQFVQSGQPFEWEDETSRGARTPRRRLSREGVSHLVAGLGLDLKSVGERNVNGVLIHVSQTGKRKCASWASWQEGRYSSEIVDGAHLLAPLWHGAM